MLVAGLPAEEEVVAAEIDILDAELDLEAYICNVHVRPSFTGNGVRGRSLHLRRPCASQPC